MSNVNSTKGWVNLPVQNVTTTSPTLIVAPPSSALYQGLPSPAFPAGSALYIDLSNTTQTYGSGYTATPKVNDLVDGHQFKIRVVGVATTGVSSTFAVNFYNGSSSTVTSNVLVASTTAYTSTQAQSINFVAESNFLWDSTTQKLNGWFNSDVNNTLTANAAITSVTSVSSTALQFCVGVTFGTANAANSVVIKELLFEEI